MYQDVESSIPVGSYKLIVTCVAGVCGLVLVETMKDKSEKERSQIRAKDIAEKNTSIQMATMVLNISQVALVVVDKQRRIILYNSTFETNHGNHASTDMRSMFLEDVLNLSTEDSKAG